MAIKENTKNFSNWKPTLIKSFKYKFYNDYWLNTTKHNIIATKKVIMINK